VVSQQKTTVLKKGSKKKKKRTKKGSRKKVSRFTAKKHKSMGRSAKQKPASGGELDLLDSIMNDVDSTPVSSYETTAAHLSLEVIAEVERATLALTETPLPEAQALYTPVRSKDEQTENLTLLSPNAMLDWQDVAQNLVF
jgi:hypothetical protein